MELHCHETAMALPWDCHGTAMDAVGQRWKCAAMKPPWHCNGTATGCHGTAMELRCHGTAKTHCHGAAM
eukprot:11051570-Lingulodinium_polyedra.AAC.1